MSLYKLLTALMTPDLDEQNPHPVFVSCLLCSESILKIVATFFLNLYF